MSDASAAGIPAPIGPYRPWVAVGGLLYLSGQTPLDPGSMELVPGDVGRQTAQAMANLGAVLRAAGATWADVVKTTIFLTDMADFAAVNEAYAAALGDARPARTTIAVRGLPRGARVEIEAVAVQ